MKATLAFAHLASHVILACAGVPPAQPYMWTPLGADIEGEARQDAAGKSVSFSADGKRVAVGAPGHDSKGHTRVFEYSSSSGWEQLGADIDGEAANDKSGASVSLSADGTRLAVGAYYNDGGGTGPMTGHARVLEYKADSRSWEQMGADIDGEAAGDLFGAKVSLSADGRCVAVSAHGNDGNGRGAGHVRVFEYTSNNGWEQMGADIDGENANDLFGISVSLSADGTRVAAGAEVMIPTTKAGYVRVLEYSSGSGWARLGADLNGEDGGDQFGASVSLSADGSRVAVGAVGSGESEVDYYFGNGHVSVFQYSSGGGWSQMGSNIEGEVAGDGAGKSVSLSADGSVVAVGAPSNDGNGNSAGRVRVFQYSSLSSGWSQVGADIDGEAEEDQSGWSVSLSGDGTRLAVGADYNSGNGKWAGHVRVFEYGPPSSLPLPSPPDRPLSLPPPSPKPQCGVAGDVNGDGLLNVIDAVRLVQIVLGNELPMDAPALGCPKPGDTNCDGIFNVVDVVAIVRVVIGGANDLCREL